MTTRDDIIKELSEKYPIESIVSFSELDIHDKLASNASQQVIYTEQLNREREQLDKVIALRDKIIGERYDHYRFNYDRELKPAEVEKYYLPKDEKVMKANLLVQRQQWRVDYFAMCVKAITSQQWNMKNFLESIR